MKTNSEAEKGLNTWLRTQCLADPRKTVLLVALVLIAAAVIVNGLSDYSGGPRPVSAAKPLTVAPSTPEAQTPPAAPADPDRRERDAYLAQLEMDVERDLFSVDYSAYPLVAGEVVAPTPAATAPRADPEAQRQARVAALRAKAQTLSLQSTMGSTAIINGQVVTAGQTVAGFEVKRVGANECVLAAEGVEITLRMK